MPVNSNTPSDLALSAAEQIGFDALTPALAEDIEESLQFAIDNGTSMEGGTSPRTAFCRGIAGAIKTVEENRGPLLREFLWPGPIPSFEPGAPEGIYMPDRRTAAAINFIFGSMMNTFKGALAELLAAKPLTALVSSLRSAGKLPSDARLFLGDTVKAPKLRGRGEAKAADLHVLSISEHGYLLHGVGEIKSYRKKQREVSEQIDKHLARARERLNISNTWVPAAPIGAHAPLRVRVRPSDWELSRQFHLQEEQGQTRVVPAQSAPGSRQDEWQETGDSEHTLTLRWSEEALEEAAYGFTFLYMELIGERMFAEQRPPGWEEMTPAETGQNAVKQALYTALMRPHLGKTTEENAIALYNSYGFGYAIGMSFRSASGKSKRREMLFWEDLVEISKNGFSILPPTEKRPLPKKRAIEGFKFPST